MKKLIIGILLGIAFTWTAKTYAGWGRLVTLDECAAVNFGNVCIVYDKIEKLNCYVWQGVREGGISCMKAEK